MPALRVYPRYAHTHTTAWDRLWGGVETLKRVSIYVDRLHLTEYCNACSSDAPCIIDPRDLRVTQTTYFSLSTYAKQHLLVALCDTTAGIGKN